MSDYSASVVECNHNIASQIHEECCWVLDRRPYREEPSVRFEFNFEDDDEIDELVACWATVAVIGRPTDG